MKGAVVENFAAWRDLARKLVAAEISPNDVRLLDSGEQSTLFGDLEESFSDLPRASATIRVPQAFVSLAETVGFHRDSERWNRLYRLLWRLQHGEPHLLDLSTDDDVHTVLQMEKAVRRDAHKTKAFVRFRKVQRDQQDYYIAWHRPDHYILGKVAPFFSRRFKEMRWSILTPYESVSWDLAKLHYGPGVPRSVAPKSDELEDLWRTYYASIFNPARVKEKMMKSEMPVRHWATLPEAELIPDLLFNAPRRREEMIAKSEGFAITAQSYLETNADAESSLAEMSKLAQRCEACDLYKSGAPVQFGVGDADAKLVIVDEIADSQGREGVMNTLISFGVEPAQVYFTSLVKHPKSTSPSPLEIRCCRPWLEAEWRQLNKANVLLCLGRKVAKTLIGVNFKHERQRGNVLPSSYCEQTIATWPSSVLKQIRGDRRNRVAELQTDLKTAVEILSRNAKGSV